MSEDNGAASDRWRLRGLLEGAGLRVVDLRPFPQRAYRWSVRVLADETTERDIRSLTGVDVVRYRRLATTPDQYVVTVDEPRPDPAPVGSHPLSRTRRERPGRWSQDG